MERYNKLSKEINEKIDTYLPTEKNIPIYISTSLDQINYEPKHGKFTNLVLSGGGIKGFGHIGALCALEENKLINALDTVVGTSVGAIIGSMYLAGYTPVEMLEFLQHFKLNGVKNIEFQNIFELFGVDKGEKINYLLEALLKNKKMDPKITMIEFYRKTGIELILTTVCINDRNIKYLSYKNYPNLELIIAIRMSFSIPFYFTPVSYQNNLYIDGGCIDNYPIHLFDDQQDNTIGLYLFSSVDKVDNFPNIESYSLRIVQCLIEGFDQMSTRNYSKSTILIDLETSSLLDFDLDYDKIKNIYDKGYNATIKYIKQNNLHI